MIKWVNWWTRAEELLDEANGNCILAIDRMQVELREADIFASEWLASARIDMANQLMTFAIAKRERKQVDES